MKVSSLTTIRQALLHTIEDDRGIRTGFGTDPLDEKGDFLHYNEIIDKHFSFVFEGMDLNEYVDTDFKKEFCKRFYNRHFNDMWANFQIRLESFLNNDAYNLLKFKNDIRDMTPDELMATVDLGSNGKTKNGGIGIVENTPKQDLKILYPSGKGLIKHASQLQESFGNGSSEGTTKGYSGTGKGFQLMALALMEDTQAIIFSLADTKLFSGVFE